MPGIWELLIILVIVLLLFGGKRLKNLGGDLGSAIKGFKKSINDNSKNPSDDIIEAKIVEEDKNEEGKNKEKTS